VFGLACCNQKLCLCRQIFISVQPCHCSRISCLKGQVVRILILQVWQQSGCMGPKVWCKNYKHFGVQLLLGIFGKKRINARGSAWEFLRSGMLYRPGKSLTRRGKSSSLHLKKFFLLGGAGFLWVTS